MTFKPRSMALQSAFALTFVVLAVVIGVDASRAIVSQRTSPRRSARTPQVIGRWSLTTPLFANPPAHGERARALARYKLQVTNYKSFLL